jgi:putative component of toxin-antitoxin plasmid stabilization module
VSGSIFSYSIEYDCLMHTIERMPEFDDWFGDIKDSVTRKRLGLRLAQGGAGKPG